MKLFGNDKTKQNTQYLVIITGCAGSGKTTIGEELAKQLKYAYIDKDTVTREFTDFILCKLGSFAGDRESDLYRTEILPIEYRVTFKVCREVLSNGNNVILTIPFISQISDWNKWLEIKKESKIPDNVVVKFIWIHHNIDTEKKNILKRGALRDSYKIKHWEEYAKSVEGIEPTFEYNAYIYVNDCEVKLSDTLEEVKRWIKKS